MRSSAQRIPRLVQRSVVPQTTPQDVCPCALKWAANRFSLVGSGQDLRLEITRRVEGRALGVVARAEPPALAFEGLEDLVIAVLEVVEQREVALGRPRRTRARLRTSRLPRAAAFRTGSVIFAPCPPKMGGPAGAGSARLQASRARAPASAALEGRDSRASWAPRKISGALLRGATHAQKGPSPTGGRPLEAPTRTGSSSASSASAPSKRLIKPCLDIGEQTHARAARVAVSLP